MSEENQEFKVRSVADLIPLLEHSAPEVRAAAYSSLSASPEKALALTASEGRDIVEVLINQLTRKLSISEKIPILSVLGQFQDQRVDDIFLNIFRFENNDELLHLAARFIRDTQLAVSDHELLKLLHNDYSLTKIRIAAELLASSLIKAQQPYDFTRFDFADRIRIAAFNDAEIPFPPLNAESAEAWLSQVNSPLRDYYCQVLENRGPELKSWKCLWQDLDSYMQSWLVRCACSSDPISKTIIDLGLASPFEAVRSATATAVRLYGISHGTSTMQSLQ